MANGGFLYEGLRHLDKAMRGKRTLAYKGAYTLAFLRKNPNLRATILDFPQTVDTARRYATEDLRHFCRPAGLQARLLSS